MAMNLKKNKILVFVIAFTALCFAFYFAQSYFSSEVERVSYSEFYRKVEDGNIFSVRFEGDNIYFELVEENSSETIKSNSAKQEKSLGKELSSDKKRSLFKNKSYKTQNPHSPTLQEELMRRGIEVKVVKDGGEVLSFVFDLIFYAFFISIIVIAFRKFISPNTFKVVHKTGVKFDDIVGLDKLKNDMKIVMEIMKNPSEYAKKGIRLPKGILLEGEPGNGKTLFAKALAGEAKINFIPAKATDFESMFMAIGPMKVKLLFRKARRKAPCIVFIDEFDGIGTVRNYSGSAIETENTRIVTALLNELDGFESSKGVLVIAATNSIKALDPALIRPGRFDSKLTVPYPNELERRRLVEMYTVGKSPSSECSTETLAKIFNGFSCAKIESLLNQAALKASEEGRREFTLEDVKSACKEC